MKALLIAVNKEKFPYPVTPVGASFIADSLEKNKHTVKFLDLMFFKNSKAIIRKTIRKFSPDVILISIRNIDNQILNSPVFYLRKVKDIINLIHTLTDMKIVIGGTGFSSNPEAVFDYLEPDSGIVGEGEESINSLLRNFSDRNIPGLVYRKSGSSVKIVKNNRKNDEITSTSQFDALNFIDTRKYIKNGAYIGIQTRRGCLRNCIFCSDCIINGRTVKYREPSTIVDDIKKISRLKKVRYFYFIDELFSMPIDYAKRFLKILIKAKVDIKFEISDAPPLADDEYVQLLKESGCIGVMFGIDSGSDLILRNLKKGFRKKDIMRVANLYYKHKIPYYVTALFGGPGENSKTVLESIDTFSKLPEASAVLINYGLRILKGTELEDIVKKNGLIEKEDALLFARYFLSKDFGEDEIKIINTACNKYHGWASFSKIDRFLIIKAFTLVKNFLPRPQWKYARSISKFLMPIKRIVSLIVTEDDFNEILNNSFVVYK